MELLIERDHDGVQRYLTGLAIEIERSRAMAKEIARKLIEQQH